MNKDNKDAGRCFSFPTALKAIADRISPPAPEEVALQEAFGRIAVGRILAPGPLPSFTEATRDGYVLPAAAEGTGELGSRFRIVGEIPAGTPWEKPLAPGTACRIMTGGCVPPGTVRVVPYEQCLDRGDSLVVPEKLMQGGDSYIRKVGSEIAAGDLLVDQGIRLQGPHLALLASCGMSAAAVAPRPAVGYVCTGSELVAPPAGLDVGRKFSSNAFLLAGLGMAAGGRPVDMGIIGDSREELQELFARVEAANLAVLVTTGGMGPGKYDLVARAFADAGGEVVFTSLAMRPGKSVLFGLLDGTLFFGLPGPPHAVRILLNELVGPAILALQGARHSWPEPVQARLLHPIDINRNDLLRLKDGICTIEAGQYRVRLTDRLEIPNCFILLPPGRPHYAAEASVDIHLSLGSGLNS